MKTLARVSITALAVLAAACSDHAKPIVAPDAPAFQISDAAHAGKPHFYFLPPMVGNPSVTGTFDAALSPSVEICVLVGEACGAVVATFTSAPGSGSESVRSDATAGHYIVNWHTDQSGLDPAVTYRIRALVGDVELGFADVDVVSSGSQLKNVRTGEYIPLLNGRTLPIKFRVEAAFAAKIDVTPDPAAVVVTLTRQFQAVVRDLHGAALPGTVVWGSGDESIATVDQHGLATGLAGGSAAITASALGVTGSSTLTVIAVARIAVTPANATAKPGGTQQFTATMYDASDHVITGPPVTWSSSAAGIATIDQAGLATAVAHGVATIQATAAGVSGSATFDVNGVVRLAVTPAADTARPGGTRQFTATLYDASDHVITGPTVTWSSSAAAVATVDQAGLATAVSHGTATIQATFADVSGSATFDVNGAARIAVTPASATAKPGVTQQFTATIYDANDHVIAGPAVTWSSSAAGIATIDQAGLATAVGHGVATIQATALGVSGSATFDVNGVVRIAVTPATATATPGATQQFVATLFDAHDNVITGPTVTWSSSAAGIATIDQAGLATAVGHGTATMQASFAGVAGSATFDVNGVVRIAVTPATATASPGATQQFTATLYDAHDHVITGPTVTWSSSAAGFATVNQAGLATAVAFGTATIQATFGGVSGSATFDVNGVARIEVSPEDATAQPGGTQQFVATVYDAHDNVITGQAVTWSSSAAAVATVNQAGLATAVAAGDASIEAAAAGVTGNALFTVSVPTPQDQMAAMPLDAIWSLGIGTDVNDDGIVVGYLYPTVGGAGKRSAFRWDGDTTHVPDVLPMPGATWCEAWGIGNLGTIVGTCLYPGEGTRAVTWTGSGDPARLPFVTSAAPNSAARDIYEDGSVTRITGSMYRNFNYTCSFPPCTSAGSNPVTWTSTGGGLPTAPPVQLGWFALLNTPGGSGYAINGAGHVSGQRTTVIQYVCGAQCFNYAEIPHGFRLTTSMGDLGVVYIYPNNFGTSNGLGINSADAVVGYVDAYANTSNNATRHEAVRWPNGAASRTSIPGVPGALVTASEAQDVNDIGWIVGFYGTNAFVWKNAGTAEVLAPRAAGKAAGANAISQVKNGQLYIAGSAVGADNRRVPMRWVRVP